MGMVEIIFGKIKVCDIQLNLNGNGLEFSTPIKDEKALLLAAGRIQTKKTVGSGDWELKSNLLIFASDVKRCSFGAVAKLFNQMTS